MKLDPTSLDRLHDVIAPPPVPWWPPAPGWIWALAALAGVLIVSLVRWFLVWQRDRYRREALAEWRRQESLLNDPSQRALVLAEFAKLLKRTALSAFPREQVAALTGPKWFVFLDRTGATSGFTSETGAALENAAYAPLTAVALDETQVKKAAALVKHWLKHHRVGGAT